MNFLEALQRTAEEVNAEYAGYDVRAARQELEDRIIHWEMSAVLHQHPSNQNELASDDQVNQDSDTEASREAPLEKGIWVTDWTSQAACKGMDPDALFIKGAAKNRAKLICRGCPVRTECLADALDNRIEFGVWGGMTDRERRALLRRRPDVDSWRDLLQLAKEEHERKGQDERKRANALHDIA